MTRTPNVNLSPIGGVTRVRGFCNRCRNKGAAAAAALGDKNHCTNFILRTYLLCLVERTSSVREFSNYYRIGLSGHAGLDVKTFHANDGDARFYYNYSIQ